MNLNHIIENSAHTDWDFSTSIYLANALYEMLYWSDANGELLSPEEKMEQLGHLLKSESIPFAYRKAHHKISGEILGDFIDCAGSLWGVYGIKSFSHLLNKYDISEIELKTKEWTPHHAEHPNLSELKREFINLEDAVLVNTLKDVTQKNSLNHLFNLKKYKNEYKDDYQDKSEKHLGFRLYIRTLNKVEEQEKNRLKENILRCQEHLKRNLESVERGDFSFISGEHGKRLFEYLMKVNEKGIQMLEPSPEKETTLFFNFSGKNENVNIKRKAFDLSTTQNQKSFVELINFVVYYQQHFYLSKDLGFYRKIDELFYNLNQVVLLNEPRQMRKTIPSNSEEFCFIEGNQNVQQKSTQTLFQIHAENLIQQTLKKEIKPKQKNFRF